jgi:hypothetical protein
MPRRRGSCAGRRARDSKWTFDLGGVFSEGIGVISIVVNIIPLHCRAVNELSVSVSVSVSEWEWEWGREMEEGRPVGRKRRTDSSSPSSSLKCTDLGLGGGEWLGERESGVFGSEMTLRPREHLRDDFRGLSVGEEARRVGVQGRRF